MTFGNLKNFQEFLGSFSEFPDDVRAFSEIQSESFRCSSTIYKGLRKSSIDLRVSRRIQESFRSLRSSETFAVIYHRYYFALFCTRVTRTCNTFFSQSECSNFFRCKILHDLLIEVTFTLKSTEISAKLTKRSLVVISFFLVFILSNLSFFLSGNHNCLFHSNCVSHQL